MICQKCKVEYREGFFRCADCDVPLVDELKETEHVHNGEASANFITVAAASTTEGANAVKNLLESHGLHVIVHEGEGIPLAVHKNFVDLAKTVLQEYKTEADEVSEEEPLAPFPSGNETEESTASFTCKQCKNVCEGDSSFCYHCGTSVK